MALIKSISGIRGTIGGNVDEGLDPLAIVRFTAAYATFIRQATGAAAPRIVVGRDARLSGDMLRQFVTATLTAMGCHVTDIGHATTPTVELAVIWEQAAGGLILTASHNPAHWNALKLLNGKGEFLNAEEGAEVLSIAEANDFIFAPVDKLGHIACADYAQRHIDAILRLPLVDTDAIRAADFRIAVDMINSVGTYIIPNLLQALGVRETILINGTPDGHFAHNPEPLPEHLEEISRAVSEGNFDLGFVVDPDVDRLAIICEDGNMFGEEYTLVAVADYVFGRILQGGAVSNLSSSRALKDVALSHGRTYHASAVGEVNVVACMKATGAVIGGEGNGGIIYPELHYGRDALVGIALFLSHLARKRMKPSELRKLYPAYSISKQKLELSPDIDIDALLTAFRTAYPHPVTDIDGIRVDFPDRWIHLRKSNTEPVIRIYAEAPDEIQADELTQDAIRILRQNIFV
ncbi:MAG: phosphoglucosamine mutase [Tannerellaceae bacterium]|jgi:phosphomannomutase|nr:phosphoglucosamine mutase [Tannerellaceae bacterium]